MINQSITKVFIIHSQEDIDVCTTFHGNPSNSCRDISLKPINVNLMVAPEETSGIHPKSLRFTVWESCMSVENVVPVHPVDEIEIFYWISENFDLLVALLKMSEDHQNHQDWFILGTMNICTKVHHNQSSSCWDISLKTKTVNLLVALEEKWGDHQSLKDSWQNHPTLTDWPTDLLTLPWLRPRH